MGLFCSLVVQQGILLYLLPDCSRVSRPWLRWVLSSGVLWTLCRHVTLPMSLMLSRWVPEALFLAYLINRCRLIASVLYWAVHKTCQFEL